MFDLSETQGKVSLAIIVVVILCLGYFLWTKSAPPAPTIPPGQSLQNPFGPGGSPPPRGLRPPGR